MNKQKLLTITALTAAATLPVASQAQTVPTNLYDIPGTFAVVSSYGIAGLGLWATIGLAALGLSIVFAFGRKAKPSAR